MYERQKGKCEKCGKHFEINEMDGDHIKKWKSGGKTELNNCRMLCRNCNRADN
jgi:5-methylcytosine-specific restriction endonuclease McrA